MVDKKRAGTRPEKYVMVPESMHKEMLELLPAARQAEVSALAKTVTQHLVYTDDKTQALNMGVEQAKQQFGQTFYKPGQKKRIGGSLGRFG